MWIGLCTVKGMKNGLWSQGQGWGGSAKSCDSTPWESKKASLPILTGYLIKASQGRDLKRSNVRLLGF